MKISEYANSIHKYTDLVSLGLAYQCCYKKYKIFITNPFREISDGISSIVDSVSKDKSAVMDEVAGLLI